MPFAFSRASRASGDAFIGQLPAGTGGALPITLAGWIRLPTLPLAADQTFFSSLASDEYSGVSFGIDTQGFLSAGYAFEQGGNSSSGMTIAV